MQIKSIPGTLNKIQNIDPNVISLGRYSYYDGQLALPRFISKLTIGSFSSIAGGLNFVTYGHPTNYISTFPFYAIFENDDNSMKHIKVYDEIYIGNDVYIGDSVSIVAPCHISDGCVIASKSVVAGHTKMEPYTIYGGNPAEFIKYRISKSEDREYLLNLKWWNFDIEKIYEIHNILQSDDIDKLKELYPIKNEVEN